MKNYVIILWTFNDWIKSFITMNPFILSAESSTKKDKKFFGKDNFIWVFKTYYDDLVVNL